MDAYRLLVLLKEGRLIFCSLIHKFSISDSLIALQIPLVMNSLMYKPSREAPLHGSDFMLMTA